jgi:hypothetical protein
VKIIKLVLNSIMKNSKIKYWNIFNFLLIKATNKLGYMYLNGYSVEKSYLMIMSFNKDKKYTYYYKYDAYIIPIIDCLVIY